MASEYEDELEFFSFLPADFHMELYQGMSKIIVGSLGSAENIRGRMDRIETALQKNMLIFERFTLRNIFTFPEDFVYNRKESSTDPIPSEDLKEKILSLAIKKAEVSAVKEGIEQKTRVNLEMLQKCKSLQSIPSLSPVLDGLSELNQLMRSTRDIKNKYIQGHTGQKQKTTKKELEDEIRKNECEDLERRIPLAILSTLDKSLSL
ncbi:hypothetical protein NEIG_02025 [Nematocida sp. ERTm5]|nr:hypothetical protein NEIRO02_1293 [Nematocida sp. AWRm79]KAI5183629.1 hypothetical protein NEIRO03_1209 [Nematocida sp. AWRm78]OAG33512.1 hypothetical protein NEIG_02025 [Nematocida sp. ERTm5]